jgi:hypothetical protein
MPVLAEAAMSEIKSAREIAQEKLARIGEATEEERRLWKFVPEGERLAGHYMQGEMNLGTELNRYAEENRSYVTRGILGILVGNISLPKDDAAKQRNKLALDGFHVIKQDKTGVDGVTSKIRHIFTHYADQGERQRRQAYEGLKQEFQARVQRALQQQTGSAAGMRIDVEKQPQFNEEWRKIQAQLEAQYMGLLEEYKKELLALK